MRYVISKLLCSDLSLLTSSQKDESCLFCFSKLYSIYSTRIVPHFMRVIRLSEPFVYRGDEKCHLLGQVPAYSIHRSTLSYYNWSKQSFSAAQLLSKQPFTQILEVPNSLLTNLSPLAHPEFAWEREREIVLPLTYVVWWIYDRVHCTVYQYTAQ